MLKRHCRRLLLGLTLTCAAFVVVHAQDSRCVTCHFESFAARDPLTQSSTQLHLDEWDTSAHAAANVGCEACHDGDPQASDPASAHQDVLSSRNPASPVFRLRIPETCGSCHDAQHEAFRTSRHHAILEDGDRRAPTCITCHGAVGARLPSTRGISSTCAACHGPNGSAPLSNHHELVRVMRDRIQDHRYSLALVQAVIENTQNPMRRQMLQTRYDDAIAPLTEAVAAWHAFAFDRAAAPLATAGARIEGLLDEVTR